jgi:phosphohistidine phosphatase SixA
MNRMLAVLLAPATTLAQSSGSMQNPLIDSVKAGGYVIVFRHAHTDRSRMEQQGWTLEDRSSQRNLSDRGVEESRHIGHAFKALGVPVGEVLASPMFRTRETAEHAFGAADTTELLRQRGSTPEARALLTRATNRGMNRVLVTHNAYLHRYFEGSGHGRIGEGDAVIVRPQRDTGFAVLGRINLSDWDVGKGPRPSPSEYAANAPSVERTVVDTNPPDAASAALIRAQFLSDFSRLHEKLLALAQAIPADKYQWRPVADVRSVAEIYQHLISDHFRGVAVGFGIPATVIAHGPAAFQQTLSTVEKAELVRHLQEVGAFLTEKIGSLVPAQLAGTRVTYGRSSTIVWTALNMTGETHEHLGQLVVYARILGVTPPWSQ